MEQFKDREIQLIICLNKSEFPLTSEHLSSKLHVTSRTIKSDIKNINHVSAQYGFHIFSKKHYGYVLQITDDNSYQEFLYHLNKTENHPYKAIPENRIQRINYMIMKLLTVDYYIKIDDFSNELFIDRSTFLSCLNEVKMILSKYHISVLNVYKQGIMISGSELNIRICTAEYFFHNTLSPTFLTEENIMFSNEYSLEEIRDIRRLLIRICEHNGIQMSDFSLENMVIHIFVSIRRWFLYNFAKIEKDSVEYLLNTKELKAGIELVKELENKYAIMLPFDESVYFAIHFKTKHIETDIEGMEAHNEDIHELIMVILHRVEQHYGLDLRKDEELIHMLSLHFPPMLTRLKLNLTLRNASLYEYFSKYMYAYFIAFEAYMVIKENYGMELEINEYGFLVLYFNWALSRIELQKKYRLLLCCGSGRPESIMLVNELNEKMGNQIESISMIDYKDMKKVEGMKADALISTINIECHHLPVIYISNKNINNIQQIKHELNKLRTRKIDFKTIILKENFYVHVKGTTKFEVLNEIEKYLNNDKKLLAFQHIRKTEERLSSEIGKNVAVLHNQDKSDQIEIYVFVTKKPVIWDKQLVRIILWVSTHPSKASEFSLVMEMLSKVISREEKINAFLKNPQYDLLIEMLSQSGDSLD